MRPHVLIIGGDIAGPRLSVNTAGMVKRARTFDWRCCPSDQSTCGPGSFAALEDAMISAKLLRNQQVSHEQVFARFVEERRSRAERVVAEARKRGDGKRNPRSRNRMDAGPDNLSSGAWREHA